MAIWFEDLDLDQMNSYWIRNMIADLGIRFTDYGDDYLAAEMPVGSHVLQTYDLVHGGAFVSLAETVGSIAGNLVLNPATHFAVGMEINANHIRAVREGTLRAEARPYHLGRSNSIWEIKILHKESGKLACISRHTMAVREGQRPGWTAS